jgi:hypothetical protein
VEERHKDFVEDTSAAVIEAAVSMIPVVGGPAAVAVNRSFGSAVQRRNERIFAEIATDVELLVQRLDSLEPDALVASEEFQAAVHRVFRAAQETPSDDKRKLLRSALLNGYIAADAAPQRDAFLSMMARYQPEHVLVLQTLRTLMVGRETMLEHAASRIADRLEGSLAHESVRACLRELVNDGLVSESTENRVEEINVGMPRPYGPPQTRQVAKTTAWHSISAQGEAFLDFVADPFHEANHD